MKSHLNLKYSWLVGLTFVSKKLDHWIIITPSYILQTCQDSYQYNYFVKKLFQHLAGRMPKRQLFGEKIKPAVSGCLHLQWCMARACEYYLCYMQIKSMCFLVLSLIFAYNHLSQGVEGERIWILLAKAVWELESIFQNFSAECMKADKCFPRQVFGWILTSLWKKEGWNATAFRENTIMEANTEEGGDTSICCHWLNVPRLKN